MNEGFTESAYKKILKKASVQYRFVPYGELCSERHVIWRHDIDFSPQRALALAKLEAAENLCCEYHVLVRGRYYNPLEPEISKILREISNVGHKIGLHFDLDIFAHDEQVSRNRFEASIGLEKTILEDITGAEVASLSFHNLTLHNNLYTTEMQICDMFNANFPNFHSQYKYISDSNGLWRNQTLVDVLDETPVEKLHVLTHPEWWTRKAMPPYERIKRTIMGRAKANIHLYLNTINRDGRLKRIAQAHGVPEEDIIKAGIFMDAPIKDADSK
ncbi:MAG: hypothetical protein P8J18_02725 [Halieaceae bacterium]|nr:hypothetical protein [Halieaceae bacterium]